MRNDRSYRNHQRFGSFSVENLRLLRCLFGIAVSDVVFIHARSNDFSMTSENHNSLTVVKVGGSLLNWMGLRSTLEARLQQIEGSKIVLFGGGPLVDSIRSFDHQFGLGDETSHWLCIDAMSINSKIGSKIISRVEWTDQFRQLHHLRESKPDETVIFDCSKWLAKNDETNQSRFEKSWNLTSDSIAAALAVDVGATDLELLKSRLTTPQSPTLQKMIETGLVDPLFCDTLGWEIHSQIRRLAMPRMVRITNLRGSSGNWPYFAFPREFDKRLA